MTAYQRPITLSGDVFRETASTASAWSVLRPWQQGVFIVLSVAILCSALSVVLVQFAHRQEMRKLHAGMIRQDELSHAWSQHLVEQSAWAAMDHVEAKARQQLGMVIPDLTQVTYINLDRAIEGRRVAEVSPMNKDDTLAWQAGSAKADIEIQPYLARQKATVSDVLPES